MIIRPWRKRREHLHSNLFPLCLASFILLVSLVISGSTLFSFAASRWPFTMTGNTAKRANTVAGWRKAEDENRRRKSKTRRFLKKTRGKYKPSPCLGGLKWRTDTDREEVLKHAYPQQWLPTRANPDPCEWTLTYSGPAPLVCDQLVQALLNEALQQRPAGPPLQSVPHQRPAQRPAVLKQEQDQQTREEEQSSLLLVTHWKLSHLGSKMIKNDKSTKWLK